MGNAIKTAAALVSGESISLSMDGYRGPFEPEVERRKAVRETLFFVFHNGEVTENGKPAR